MGKQKTFKEIVLNWIWTALQQILPSKPYLSLKYRVVFKRKINWSTPKTFTEKLQWLKLNYQNQLAVTLADKIAAKEYVAQQIGEKYIIKTLGVWKDADDIDFSVLPRAFVLKCNHDSGSSQVCRDKTGADLSLMRSKAKVALKRNYYLMGRETPYKDIRHKIFAEEVIPSNSAGDLYEYKFFCFDGKPEFLKINFGRGGDFHANYYDIDFNLLPFGEINPCPDEKIIFTEPKKYDQMLEIAKVLSQGFPFARIDLYNVEGKIYFSEVTFFPTSGFGPFTSDEWDLKIGDMLQLPSVE